MSATPVNDLLAHDRFGPRQLSIVALCLLFNMVDGFDITAMAVIANSVGEEMALAPDQIGLIFSFALAGMMIGAMFLAAASDIVGRRRVIILSLVLVGVTVLLSSQATSLGELVALRFASGLGAGAMLASQAALASEYSPERTRALAVAIVTAGYPLGAMMTGLVAHWIMPDFGWRGVFVFGGALTLALALVAVLFVPESLQYLAVRRPAGALQRINAILAQLGRQPLERLPEAPASEHEGTERPVGEATSESALLGAARRFGANMRALLDPVNRAKTLTLWLTFFLCFSTLYFLLSWIPKMVEDAGFSAEMARNAFVLFNLGGVLGIFALGALSTRWKLTNLVSGFLLAAAVLMAAFAMAPREVAVLLGLIFIIGFTQQGGFTGLYGVAAKCYATEVRSTGIGWSVGLGRFGAVIGPAAAGIAINEGIDMSGAFYLFAVPTALGAVFAYRLHVK